MGGFKKYIWEWWFRCLQTWPYSMSDLILGFKKLPFIYWWLKYVWNYWLLSTCCSMQCLTGITTGQLLSRRYLGDCFIHNTAIQLFEATLCVCVCVWEWYWWGIQCTSICSFIVSNYFIHGQGRGGSVKCNM